MSHSPRTLRRTPVERMTADTGYIQALWAEKLLLDEQINKLTKRRTEIHEVLHNYARDHGSVDSKGNFRVAFDSPVKTLTKTSTGFRRQRSTQTTFDVASGLRLAQQRGFRDSVEKTEVVKVVDPDAFWAAFQEGLITREEIDALMIHEHSYSIRSL